MASYRRSSGERRQQLKWLLGGFAGYLDGAIPGVYLALIVVAAAVTAVSAARGTHAALAEHG